MDKPKRKHVRTKPKLRPDEGRALGQHLSEGSVPHGKGASPSRRPSRSRKKKLHGESVDKIIRDKVVADITRKADEEFMFGIGLKRVSAKDPSAASIPKQGRGMADKDAMRSSEELRSEQEKAAVHFFTAKAKTAEQLAFLQSTLDHFLTRAKPSSPRTERINSLTQTAEFYLRAEEAELAALEKYRALTGELMDALQYGEG